MLGKRNHDRKGGGPDGDGNADMMAAEQEIEKADADEKKEKAEQEEKAEEKAAED